MFWSMSRHSDSLDQVRKSRDVNLRDVNFVCLLMEAPYVPALPILHVLLLSRVSSVLFLIYFFLFWLMSASALYTLLCPPGAKAIVTCLSWYSALYLLLMYVVRAGSCSLEFPFSGLIQLIQETGNWPLLKPFHEDPHATGWQDISPCFVHRLGFSSVLDFAGFLWCLGGLTCQISYFSSWVQMVLKGIYKMTFLCGTHSSRIKVNP